MDATPHPPQFPTWVSPASGHRDAVARSRAAGEPAPGLVGLRSGIVRCGATRANGREVLLSQLASPGHWLGVHSALDGMPSPFDAVALVECTVAIVPHDALNRLIDRHPVVLRELARILSIWMRMLIAWSMNTALLPFDKCLASFLLHVMTFDAQGHGQAKLVQDDIAAHLGVSRQSVIRQLKLWEAQGWMAIRYGNPAVLDPDRLVQAAR